MSGALAVELRKFRRSPVVLTASALMALLVPAIAIGFYWVAENGGAGPLALKVGALDVGQGWDGYVGLTNQISAAGIFVGAGVVVTWVFGREHADHTFPSLFALPTSRQVVAMAKAVLIVCWGFLLAVGVTVVTFGLGLVFGVEAGVGDIGSLLWRLFSVVLLTSLLASTVGLVASVGRGYLPAFGALVLLVAAAQVSVLFGTGGWFPYAVPGLLSVAGTEGVLDVTPLQIALVPVVALVGVWLTARWWGRAEVV